MGEPPASQSGKHVPNCTLVQVSLPNGLQADCLCAHAHAPRQATPGVAVKIPSLHGQHLLHSYITALEMDGVHWCGHALSHIMQLSCMLLQVMGHRPPQLNTVQGRCALHAVEA